LETINKVRLVSVWLSALWRVIAAAVRNYSLEDTRFGAP
jgi:hypothetical protein